MMPTCLDSLRREHPALGFALYAYEPGGDVTLEVHSVFGEITSFTGSSAATAIEQAFPTASQPFVVTEEKTPQETSVFD